MSRKDSRMDGKDGGICLRHEGRREEWEDTRRYRIIVDLEKSERFLSKLSLPLFVGYRHHYVGTPV